MKWRLDKHNKAHEMLNVKFCHYLNNNKVCPFEEIGCKFKHSIAKECRLQKQCRNKLCQFKHSSNNFKQLSQPNFNQKQSWCDTAIGL